MSASSNSMVGSVFGTGVSGGNGGPGGAVGAARGGSLSCTGAGSGTVLPMVSSQLARLNQEHLDLIQKLKDYETTLEIMKRSGVSEASIRDYSLEVEALKSKRAELEGSMARLTLGNSIGDGQQLGSAAGLQGLALLTDCDGREYSIGVIKKDDARANLAKIMVSRRFASEIMFEVITSGTDFALNLSKYRDELMRQERDFVETILGKERDGFPSIVDMAHVAVLPIWLDDRILRQFFQGRVFYLNHWMKDRKIPETRADILGALNNIELTFRALLGCADFKDVFLEFSTRMMDRNLIHVPEEFWRVLLEDTLMRAFEVLQHPYSYESVKMTCERAPQQMLSTVGDRCTYSAVEYLKARVDRLVGVLQNPNFFEMFNARSEGMKLQLEKKYFEYKLDDEKNFPRGLVSPEVARKGKDGGGVASGRGGDVKDKPTGMKKTDGPGGGGKTPVGNRRNELSTRDGERGTTTPRGKGPGMRGRSPDRPYGHKRYRSPSPPPRGYESGGGRERGRDIQANRNRSVSRDRDRKSRSRSRGERRESHDGKRRSRSPSERSRGGYGRSAERSRRSEDRYGKREKTDEHNLKGFVCMQAMLKLADLDKSSCRFGAGCVYSHFSKLEDCPLDKLQQFLAFRGLKAENARLLREKYAAIYPEVAPDSEESGSSGNK